MAMRGPSRGAASREIRASHDIAIAALSSHQPIAGEGALGATRRWDRESLSIINVVRERERMAVALRRPAVFKLGPKSEGDGGGGR